MRGGTDVSALSAKTRVARFLILGFFATAIDLASFWILLRMGMFRPLATATSFLLASTVNYQIAKTWVFGSGTRSAAQSYTLFLIGILVGLCISISVVEFVVLAAGFSPLVGKLIALAPVTLWNYLTRKNVIFRHSDKFS